MNSRILGTVALDDASLVRDLEQIARLPTDVQYSEYTFGHWHSYVLANGSGDHDDLRFRPHDGPARLTEIGRRLPYLCSLVNEHFCPERLRWIRVFTVQNALLVSHRDFIEFDRSLLRLHLVLDTNPTCLHSEADQVFHMRRGEVWFLDGTSVHAACTLSTFRRVSLVLDFAADGSSVEQVLDHGLDRNTAPPCLISRPPLDEAQRQALLALRGIASPNNFWDVVNLLGKIHFYRRAGAEELFDWLAEIYRADSAMSAKAAAYRRYCIESREFGERFQP